MQTEDLIPAVEFCSFHQVEWTFITHLHASGLIGMITRDGTPFLSAGELPELEKFIRWYYDLSINPEGIEVISHLLAKAETLREENRQLRNKLSRYEPGDHETITVTGEEI